MRILYLFEEILPQATDLSSQVFQTCQNLAHLNCDVHFFCSNRSSDYECLKQFYLPCQKSSPNFKLFSFMSSKSRLVPAAFGRWIFALQVQRLISTYRPDWVLATDPLALLYHLERKAPHVRYGLEISSLPTTDLSPKKRSEILLWRAALKRADLLIASSNIVKQALLTPPFVGPNALVIPFGSSFTPLDPIQCEFEDKLALFFSALSTSDKNLHFLLNAMRLCISDERITLHLVAKKSSQIDQIRSEVAKRELQHRVEVHLEMTPQSLCNFFMRVDAFIYLPSLVPESIDDTQLVDYCRLGRLIVGPDIPLLREFLPEGQARAFLFTPDSVPALAVQMRQLADPTLRFLATCALQGAFEADPHKFSIKQRAHQLMRSLQ